MTSARESLLFQATKHHAPDWCVFPGQLSYESMIS
jgi:hypothetical protein